MNIQQEVKNFERQYRAAGKPAAAVWDKNYMKSQLKLFGIRAADRQLILKQFVAEHRDFRHSDLWRLAGRMWQSDYHEIRGSVPDLLIKYRRLLGYTDLPRFEKFLRQSHDWGTVDEISVHLVGYLLAQDQRTASYLKKWNTDKLFWLRRASILPFLYLFRKKSGDRKLFYRLAVKLMDESWQNWGYAVNNYSLPKRRFFIRKAIGWCLREMSEKWPAEITKFLRQNKGRMNSLSFREGGRKL
ncbi:MAG: DNA alkylation repair protein [Patescibacteria group bacterium]|jgi:3-methyladenine DNA glycosylase AlkD